MDNHRHIEEQSAVEPRSHVQGPAQQENLLTSLPWDVLQQLCHCVSEEDRKEQSGIFERQSWYGFLQNFDGPYDTPQGNQALRSCCRLLSHVSDTARTSVWFRAEQQDDANLYLAKLPSLKTVCIEYSSFACNIIDSLSTLHSISPALTSLMLLYKLVQEKSFNPPVCMIGTQLHYSMLQWSDTLSCLELTNINCSSTSNNQVAGGSSLRFLSHLTALQRLLLKDVTPTLKTEDIIGCTGLVTLKVSGNSMHVSTNLDMRIFSMLQVLDVTHYNLTTLSVNSLASLRILNFSDNSIAELDITTCTSLQELYCSSNSLEALNTTRCLELTYIECDSNPTLSKLSVSGCTKLTNLSCSKTSVLELDLFGCIMLDNLDCGEVNLNALDLKPCPNLKNFRLSWCSNLLSLNLAGMARLEEIWLTKCSLTSLDLKECSALLELHIYKCHTLATICFLGNTALHHMDLEECEVKQLDPLTLANLRQLHITKCPFTALDLSLCTALRILKCNETDIVVLDLSPVAVTLESLRCEGAKSLKELCMDGCSNLRMVHCAGCTRLREVSCKGCGSLELLDFKGSGKLSGLCLVHLREYEQTGEIQTRVFDPEYCPSTESDEE